MTHISTPADTRPHSDRFRCGGRECNFLAAMLKTIVGMCLLVFAAAGGARAADEPAETLTKLTVERARELAANKGDLRLPKVASLSPEAAAELAKLDGRLFLDGLTELPLDLARALVLFKGNMSLGGLTSLPEELAAVLGSRAKGNTHLNGLRTVAPASASKFDSHGGMLYLDGVKSMSNETAAAFESYRGASLVLTNLSDISDKGVISLARHNKGNVLVLGITTLSPEAAAVLAQRKGKIKLRRLTSLSDEAAKNLVQTDAELTLTGLTEISAEAAELMRSKKVDLPKKFRPAAASKGTN